MVLITFQLHFELENVISSCKMFFSTQNDIFNCLSKIVDNVELNPQKNQILHTRVNF
jgi:hypothetical protein